MKRPTFHPAPAADIEPQRAVFPQQERIAEIVALEREIAALEGRRTRLLAAAIEAEESLIEPLGPRVTAQEREWARRSLVAEIACAAHRSEATIARLVNEAECLANELPATLTALESGTISYRHARSLLSHASTLPEVVRAAFEAAVLPAAVELNPARFDERARRTREQHHPESIVERTRQAAELRAVWLDPERDGMATLHHHLAAGDALAILASSNAPLAPSRATTTPAPTHNAAPTYSPTSYSSPIPHSSPIQSRSMSGRTPLPPLTYPGPMMRAGRAPRRRRAHRSLAPCGRAACTPIAGASRRW